MTTVLGTTVDNNLLSLGDSERTSGLYILGKPRVGKSWLIVNLILQNIANGHGVFFLDPHGDATTDLRFRLSLSDLKNRCVNLDPTDPAAVFGINLLQCRDIDDARLRSDTFAKAKGVFDKLWRNTFEERPWLQLILQNTIYSLIENQGYTLADLPLFFRDSAFRALICKKIRYNAAVRNYWLKTFAAKSQRDQDMQMEAAQTRAEIMLAHPYVRDIVGQSESTLDFGKLMEENKILLLKLSSSLSAEAKKIIGTIVIGQLLHAVQRREERSQFCIFVDEFQNVASFDDFSVLITQAPKYGIATTIAHHERYGQLNQDAGIIGATSAIANKVLFQITPRDADELAPEVASAPPTETIRERELVISQEPVRELLRGHRDPDIRAFVDRYLRPLHEEKEDIRDDMEFQRLILQDTREEASLHRIDAQAAGIYRENAAAERALQRAEASVYGVRRQIDKLLSLFESGKGLRWLFRALNKFLAAVMQGKVKPGQEEFREFLTAYVYCSPHLAKKLRHELELYIALVYGDPKTARVLPYDIAKEAGVSLGETAALGVRLEARMRWENLIKDQVCGTYERSLSLPLSYQGEMGTNGDARWESSGGMLITESRQKTLEADKTLAGKAEDQIRANIVYDEYQWSCYALHVEYAMLKIIPGLWRVIAPYLAARFMEGHSAVAGSTYGKTVIRYNEAADRLRQEYVHWLSSVSAVYDRFLKFLDGASVSKITTDSPQEFIRRYREGAFVVFALLAMARAKYQKMKGGSELGVMNPFELVMPNGEEVYVAPIIQAINETILVMPDHLPAGVLAGAEAAAVKKVCAERLSGDSAKGAVDDLVRFCTLLSRPENRILTTTGQYVERQVNRRTEADMVNEVVRELTALEKYTAFAKLLSRSEKFRTRELPEPLRNGEISSPEAEARYRRKRAEIEPEINARQEGWRAAVSDEPPATHTVDEQVEAEPPAVGSAGMGGPPPQFSEEEPERPPPEAVEGSDEPEGEAQAEEQSGAAEAESAAADVTNAVEKNRAAPPPFSYSEEISAVPRDNDSLAVEGALNDGEAPESYDWTSEESVPAVEETKSLEPGDRGGGQSVIPRKELHYRLVFQTVFTRHPGWKDSFRDKLKANSIYKDGAYYLFITWPDYGVIVYPEIEMNDFMVRLECEVIHDRHSYCGIAFRINNRASNAFYTCCLFKITQGWVTITDESADDRFGRSMYHRECEHVKDITSINTLTMAKVGYGATFWVNGMDVTSIIDDRFSTGCVGIYAGTRGGNHPQESLVRFRKFEVYAIE